MKSYMVYYNSLTNASEEPPTAYYPHWLRPEALQCSHRELYAVDRGSYSPKDWRGPPPTL